MNTSENLMSELIENAYSTKHSEFQFIQNWREYTTAKSINRSLWLLVSSLRKQAKKLLKKYCRSVTAGDSDVLQLLAYCTVAKVLRYYQEELDLIEDMIDEYETYVSVNNPIYALLFNEQRPADKLWDHRE